MKSGIKPFFSSIFLFAIFILSSQNVKATHSFNMEIFYRHVSDSTYEFTLIFYRNCYGFTAGAPSSVNITYQSASTSTTGSFFCGRLATSGSGVPPLLVPNLYNCLDTGWCAEEYVYRGQWTSPKKANDWIFNYQLCCWPNTPAPSNIQNGTIYIEAGLNNKDFPDTLHKNLSPIFHNRRPNHPGRTMDTINNPPQISICEGRNVLIDQKVREYDGDSVAYTFFIPQSNGGINSTYINGYTFPNPIPSVGGPFTIDSTKGSIRFTPGTPIGTGTYVIGIDASEFRNDTVVSGGSSTVVKKKIGYVRRNLVIFIEDSSNCADDAFTFSDTAGTLDTNFIVLDCPSQDFTLRLTDYMLCSSLDTNGSCMEIWHPASNTSIPIKKLSPLDCNADLISKRIEVQLDTVIQADTFKLVFKRGNDGNTILSECHLELPPYQDTLTIVFNEGEIGEFLGDYQNPGFNANIERECGDSLIRVNLSEEVKCSSVASDGSDFLLLDSQNQPVSILSVNPVCNGNKTNKIDLATSPLFPGSHTLILKSGTDSNTVTNICDAEWPADSIEVLSVGLNPDLGPDTAICTDDSTASMYLSAGAFTTYLWSTGATSANLLITSPGIYWVAVFNSYNCVAVDTVVVTGKTCYTSTEEIDLEENFTIFPNPGKGVFHLNYVSAQGNESVEVFNSSGQRIQSARLDAGGRYILELKDEANGLYFVHLMRNGMLIEAKQLVLNR